MLQQIISGVNFERLVQWVKSGSAPSNPFGDCILSGRAVKDPLLLARSYKRAVISSLYSLFVGVV